MNTVGRLTCLCVLTLALGSFIPEAVLGGPPDWAGGPPDWVPIPSHAAAGASGSVPIPSTLWLFAGGMAGLAWWRARRSQD